MDPLQGGLLLDQLTTQPIGVGLFLAGAGIVFLLLGHRIFKSLIAISFGAMGYFLGSALPGSDASQLLTGLLTGAGLAAISLFFIRPAVAILAGGWAGAIAFHMLSEFQIFDYVCYAVALFAFAAVVAMSLIMYSEIIAFVTSLEGAFLCLAALVVFVSRSPLAWAHVREMLLINPFFGPFLILAGTVTGFYLQLSELRHKHTGVHA